MGKRRSEGQKAKAWLARRVARDGRMAVAQELEVNTRTLARGLAAGELTGRLSDAVELARMREAAGDGGNPSPASPAVPQDDRDGQTVGEVEDDGDADGGAIASSASGTQVAGEEPASGGDGDGINVSPGAESKETDDEEDEVEDWVGKPGWYPLAEEDEAWAGDWWWQWKWIDQILPNTLATEKASPKESERMGVEVAKAVARWRTARDLWIPLRDRKWNVGEITKDLWRLELEAEEVAAELRMREMEVELIEEMDVAIPPARWSWGGATRFEQAIWRRKTIVRLRKELVEAEWAQEKGRRREARRERWRRRWSRLKAGVFRGGRS